MRMLWPSLLSAWLIASGVRADEPPPSGYSERCTLQRSCPLGQECVLCPADSGDYGRSVSVCEANLGPLGFKKRCQSWGASVWDEVWCRPVTGASDASVELVAFDAGRPNDDPRFGKSYPVVTCKPGADGGCDGCALGAGAEPDGGTTLTLLTLAATAGLFEARRRWGRRRERGGTQPPTTP
jgi:hypothetical protein